MRLSLAVAVCFLPFVVRSQSVPSEPPSAVIRIETTPLRSSAVGKITEIPLPVDMNLAKQFVRLGFGAMVLGEVGFQSTEFLTPVLSTRQASELVLLVPEYGPFKGAAVANGIQRFAGRVSGVAFGRELSPVLYVHLPYWTHQREGPNTKGIGTKISDKENEQLVAELKKVFVDELEAEEFGPDTINSRVIRIWWHH
ncbi:MAG TPA: hypothetical protein VIY68_18610 [Steroidobacteraceae bacterium]